MRICIYEDRHVSGLEPLTLTRPVSDLLSGLSTLGAKHTRHFAATSIGHLCRPHISDLIRGREPSTPVNDPAWLRTRTDGARERTMDPAVPARGSFAGGPPRRREYLRCWLTHPDVRR